MTLKLLEDECSDLLDKGDAFYFFYTWTLLHVNGKAFKITCYFTGGALIFRRETK